MLSPALLLGPVSLPQQAVRCSAYPAPNSTESHHVSGVPNRCILPAPSALLALMFRFSFLVSLNIFLLFSCLIHYFLSVRVLCPFSKLGLFFMFYLRIPIYIHISTFSLATIYLIFLFTFQVTFRHNKM